ncbi:unnamed protein product [Schistosoma mattheei]|uniref:Uncharacterized protein n=1 Tax=Schistosoma mattheei TaxID=31246 RepID=A0A183P5P1_9TREM|nr:unnamed protein product [Schistosoma mattheei]
MRYHSLRFIGTCSSSRIFLDRMWSMSVVASVSDFRDSGCKLSGPVAYLLLICLMATLITSIVDIYICRKVCRYW